MLRVNEFFETAREREAIRLRREAGSSIHWTTDPVFKVWRFCNVRREDDKTTQWFRQNVRSKLTGVKAVESTIIFRSFNKIETGERIKDLLLGEWDTEEARRRLWNVKPLVTGAYMISSLPGYTKLDGILKVIDFIRPQLAKTVAPWGDTLREAWEDLQQFPYLGRFTAYEVVTDLRWTPVLENAGDIYSWACAGPGCARGLGRVVHNDPTVYNYGTKHGQAEMLEVMADLLQRSTKEAVIGAPWEMREVEHWACEFDKYERALAGDSLKRKYP